MSKDKEFNLREALRAGDITLIRLNMHFSWIDALRNERFQKGKTYLHLAVMDNQLPSVQYLVEAGFDVNAQADNGSTPLHWALSYFAEDRNTEGPLKDTSIFEYLLEKGADPTIKRSFQSEETYSIEDILEWSGYVKNNKMRAKLQQIAAPYIEASRKAQSNAEAMIDTSSSEGSSLSTTPNITPPTSRRESKTEEPTVGKSWQGDFSGTGSPPVPSPSLWSQITSTFSSNPRPQPLPKTSGGYTQLVTTSKAGNSNESAPLIGSSKKTR
jgi:hypothetical protein